MDGGLLTEIFFGVISGIVFLWLGPKFMRLLYPRKKNEITHKPNLEIPENKIQENFDQFSEQKKSLWFLKNQNLISNEEYLKKLEYLEEKGQTDKVSISINGKQQQEKFINELVNKQIEPIITNLDNLLNTGIITQTEYEFKKDQIFKNKKEELIIKFIKSKNFNKLKNWQKRAVQSLYLSSKGANILLYRWKKDDVYSFTLKEFIGLAAKNEIAEYHIIDLPDSFDSILAKNKLKVSEVGTNI
jgi:2-succinyl-5-enolpyruvyl-6-hydroxy-3-cyclohexene-1-carboxylate synthase